MAVGHVSYLDLTAEQRKLAANRVREQIRQAMANPFLSPEQRAILVAHVDHITKWERGLLPMGTPFPAAPVPATES